MANLVFDFLHSYETGERRESEPANAYQYDEGHVLEAVLPEAVTSCEIHYWIRGQEKSEAYTPGSITQNDDGSCTVIGNIPNLYFETNGELRVYIVVTDGSASITTYEGYVHICQRSMPDDYVDDDPENEATRVLTEAQEAAATATAAAETCEEVLESIPEDYSTLSNDVEDLKDGLAHITSSAVPTTVRQAIKTLFETGAYADTGLTDEMAVISSWASQVTAITLNQTSISLNGSATSQLVATTTPTGGTVTWSSSDTSVATVSSNGLVTGVGNGTATIAATSGDVSATCTATVSGFKSLVSISAIYTQSGTVYDTDSLDSLKSDLVVTALYDDQTTATVTTYTLSGTLTVGTSTITVTYGGKTTTFNVTVTHRETWDYEWYASSGTVPPNMVTSGTPTFAPNNEYMEVKVTNTNSAAIDFNHVGPARIVAELATVSGNYNNNPQFIINTATNAGAKCFINTNSNISANCSGTNAEVYTPTIGDFHEYDLRCDVGDCKLYIDGVLEDSGTGRTNDQYITYTGISGALNVNFVRLKSLKYKAL